MGVSIHHSQKSIGIGAFQLRKLPVIKYFFHNRMVVSDFFQYVSRCRIACFCFFAAPQTQLFEKDNTQLLRGIEVKRFLGKRINFFRNAFNAFVQAALVYPQSLLIHLNADLLHICQNKKQRHFHVVKKAVLPVLFQLFFHYTFRAECNFCLFCGKICPQLKFQSFEGTFFSAFSHNFLGGRIAFIQKSPGNVIIFVGISCCIQKICGNCRIKNQSLRLTSDRTQRLHISFHIMANFLK